MLAMNSALEPVGLLAAPRLVLQLLPHGLDLALQLAQAGPDLRGRCGRRLAGERPARPPGAERPARPPGGDDGAHRHQRGEDRHRPGPSGAAAGPYGDRQARTRDQRRERGSDQRPTAAHLSRRARGRFLGGCFQVGVHLGLPVNLCIPWPLLPAADCLPVGFSNQDATSSC